MRALGARRIQATRRLNPALDCVPTFIAGSAAPTESGPAGARLSISDTS